MIEAVCGKCNQSFVPDGPDDLEHIEKEDGTPCGGAGRIVGRYVMPEEWQAMALSTTE